MWQICLFNILGCSWARFLVASLSLESPCQLRGFYQQQSCLFYHRGDSTASVWMETQVKQCCSVLFVTYEESEDVIPRTRPGTRKIDS